MLDERREPPRCAAMAANDHHFECRICFTTPAKPIGLIAQRKIWLTEVNAAMPFLMISRVGNAASGPRVGCARQEHIFSAFDATIGQPVSDYKIVSSE